MFKMFARLLELDMATSVTVPVIVVINLILILGVKNCFTVVK